MDRPDRPTPNAMPRSIPARIAAGVPTRTIECLSCGADTLHVKGQVTHDEHGEALVQWWDCTVCDEGEAV